LNADLTKFEVLCYLRNNSSDESVKVRRASLTEHRSVMSQTIYWTKSIHGFSWHGVCKHNSVRNEAGTGNAAKLGNVHRVEISYSLEGCQLRRLNCTSFEALAFNKK